MAKPQAAGTARTKPSAVAPPAAIRLLSEVAAEIAGERHAVVIERRVCGEQRRRRDEDLARRLDRGRDDPVDRDEEEQADDGEEQRRCRSRRGGVAARDRRPSQRSRLRVAQRQHGEQREGGGDQHQQHRGGGAAGKVEHGEHLPVDEGREHVGRVGRAAAGQHVDDVEDAERIGQADDEDHRDHRLEQRQHDGEEDLPRRGAIDLRRLDRIGRQAREAGEQHEDVEGQRQPEIGDDDGGAGEPDIGEPQRAAGAEQAGDRVDHAVAVDEDEAPGECADHRRDHQRQGDDGAEDPAAPQAAMERQRDGQPDDGFENEACGDEAERLPERGLEVAGAGDPRVVGEPGKSVVPRIAVSGPLRLSQTVHATG